MIAVLAGTFAASVAVATFAAFVVGKPPARSGGLATVPSGTVHDAMVTPHSPVPGGGALLTVSVAEALCVVSTVPMKRWFVVFTSEPVAVGGTLTVTLQVLFAARVPLEEEMETEPAEAVSGRRPPTLPA